MTSRTIVAGLLLVAWLTVGGCPPVGDSLDQLADTAPPAEEVTGAAHDGDVSSESPSDADSADGGSTRPDAYADIPISVGGGPGSQGFSSNPLGGGSGTSPGTEPSGGTDPRPPSGGDEDPSGDPDSPVVKNPDSPLPPEVEDALQNLGRELIALTRALSPAAGLADARLDWMEYTKGREGSCPVIGWASSAQYTLAAIDFEYDGCASKYTGELSFAGNLAGYWDRVTGIARFEYCSFAIEGRQVTGLLEGVVRRLSDGAEVHGTWQVNTVGQGAAAGDVRLRAGRDYMFTLTADWLTIGDLRNGPVLSVDGLRVNVVTHGNFMPDKGVVQFDLQDPDYHVAVTFTSQTPATRLVVVTVNGDPPVVYELPEVP